MEASSILRLGGTHVNKEVVRGLFEIQATSAAGVSTLSIEWMDTLSVCLT